MMDLARLHRLAQAHGFTAPACVPQAWTGATSRVYPCEDVVIKVALDIPDAARSVAIDAAMNPVARELGVRTPEIVAFDDTLDILPVPYVVVRRVTHALPLAQLPASHPGLATAWEEVGRDLALLHRTPHGSPMPIPLREFRQTPEVDPRPWVDQLLEHGALAAGEAARLRETLDELAPHALADVPLYLCHGDVNRENILVDATSGAYRALIDWAGAGWLDPAWDFVGVPSSAVPHLLAGHRSVHPLLADETVEARIRWCRIQTQLFADRSRIVDPPIITEP
jgi:aminoglycoside phosphotransferase (APT) family kinase protein